MNRLWAAASKCELCFFRTQIHLHLETIARMSCGLHYANPYFWIVICQLTSFEADMYALMSNKQIETLVLYTNPFPHEHFFSRQRSPGLSSSAAGKLFVVETCLRSYEGVNSSIPLFFCELGGRCFESLAMGRSYCIVSLKRLETTSPDLGAESGHYLLYVTCF